MNYLRKKNDDFPFVFFTKEAFHRDQVIGYIAETYAQITEQKGGIIYPNLIAYKDLFTYNLAKIARIVKLGENHYDLFFDDDDNDLIRELAQENNGDLIRTTEEFMNQSRFLSQDNESQKLFAQDIQTAFESENMFYLAGSVPYESLWFFRDTDTVPFSEENVKRLFRNMPIVSVW